MNQQFLLGANGWSAPVAGQNVVNKQRFIINVPAAVRGHTFRFIATLVGTSNDVVSFLESNRFILV